MTLLRIRQFGDPVLRERSKPVGNVDEHIRQLADNMIETMREAPGMGLAATQVGVMLQLFVFDLGDGPQALMNPEIAEGDGEVVEEEGCLSVPDIRLPIPRYQRVVLRAQTLSGERIEREAFDVEARVYQHEVDHLNGSLFIDRALPQDRRKAVQELNQMAGLL